MRIGIQPMRLRLADAQIDAWKKIPAQLQDVSEDDFMRLLRRVRKIYKLSDKEEIYEETVIAEEAARHSFKPQPRPGMLGDIMFHLAQRGKLTPEEYKRQFDEHLLRLGEEHLNRVIEMKRGIAAEFTVFSFESL